MAVRFAAQEEVAFTVGSKLVYKIALNREQIWPPLALGMPTFPLDDFTATQEKINGITMTWSAASGGLITYDLMISSRESGGQWRVYAEDVSSGYFIATSDNSELRDDDTQFMVRATNIYGEVYSRTSTGYFFDITNLYATDLGTYQVVDGVTVTFAEASSEANITYDLIINTDPQTVITGISSGYTWNSNGDYSVHSFTVKMHQEGVDETSIQYYSNSDDGQAYDKPSVPGEIDFTIPGGPYRFDIPDRVELILMSIVGAGGGGGGGGGGSGGCGGMVPCNGNGGNKSYKSTGGGAGASVLDTNIDVTGMAYINIYVGAGGSGGPKGDKGRVNGNGHNGDDGLAGGATYILSDTGTELARATGGSLGSKGAGGDGQDGGAGGGSGGNGTDGVALNGSGTGGTGGSETDENETGDPGDGGNPAGAGGGGGSGGGGGGWLDDGANGGSGGSGGAGTCSLVWE